MQFTSHGVFSVKAEKQRLYVDATGPFNEELALEYKHALNACVDALQGTVWDQVIVLHKLSLMTPDAEQVLKQTLLERKSKGLRASAVIIEQGDGRNLVAQQFKRAYDFADIQSEFFENELDAISWLTSLQTDSK